MKHAIILAASIICIQAPYTTGALSDKELTLQGIEYGISMLSTAAHELGHALTSKFFWGSPIDITVGALPSGNLRPIITLGFLKIAGFWPAGYANCQIPARGVSPIKAAISLIAGPLCGIAADVLAHSLLNKFAPHLRITKNVIRYSLWKNILNFLPLRFGNIKTDGYRICECIQAYYNRRLWRP